MPRAKKISKRVFDFNESQNAGDRIASGIENELGLGTDTDFYDAGDINTRYEVTIIVRELGDWDKT